MDSCPHCGSILIGTLGGYFRCLNEECMKLLWSVDQRERESEEQKRKTPLPDGDQAL